MKINNLLLGLTVILLIYSCEIEDNTCNGDLITFSDGTTECVQSLPGVAKTAKEGDKFYHSKYGIVKFENGKLTNIDGLVITFEQLKTKN